MALPDPLRVRLSSEAAEAIALTPVVPRDLPLREVAWLLAGAVGKDPRRVRDLLRGGALVRGATRYRWATLEVGDDDVTGLLSLLPDADPERAFDFGRCERVVLQGEGTSVVVTRTVGAERRWLRWSSFWDALLAVATAGTLHYVTLSYAERADVYRANLDGPAAEAIRQAASLLRYRKLRAQVQSLRFTHMDLHAVWP